MAEKFDDQKAAIAQDPKAFVEMIDKDAAIPHVGNSHEILHEVFNLQASPDYQKQLLKELAKPDPSLAPLTIGSDGHAVRTKEEADKIKGREEAGELLISKMADHPKDSPWTLTDQSKADLKAYIADNEKSPQNEVARDLAITARNYLMESMMYEGNKAGLTQMLTETGTKYPELISSKNHEFLSLASFAGAIDNQQFMTLFRKFNGDVPRLEEWSHRS